MTSLLDGRLPDPAPTGAATEADVANRFAANGGVTDEQAAYWLESNPNPPEPAPVEPQVDVQAAVEMGVQQHLAALANDFAAQQVEQAEQQARVDAFLGDPTDPGYWERLQQLDVLQHADARVDAAVAAIEERYRPFVEYVQAEQSAAIDAYAAERSAEVFDEEGERLGEFDRTEAYGVAEELTAMAYQDLFARGASPEDADRILRDTNFAEAAIRAGARHVAQRDGATAPSRQYGSELDVARRFGTPRSPSEAVRQTEIQRQAETSPALQRELTRLDERRQAVSEADVARNFIDRRRAAAV